MRVHFTVLFILFYLLSGAQVSKKNVAADTSKDDFIKIDHFGKFIEDREGIESVQWISEGLQLRIDSTFIYADSAVIFGENRMRAYGNVVIQQGDSLHVFTDTLYYDRETDIAELVGEVALEQGTKQLWTTRLMYHLAEKFGEYDQGGVLVDRSIQVSSKRGTYFAVSEQIIFEDSVIVLHPKFNLAADSMRYLSAESKVLFTGPTNIYTENAKIYCESGFYNLDTETAEFNRNAQYAGDQKKATADTIRYFVDDGEVFMLGNVFVEENDKRITGTSLRYLEKSGLTWIFGDPAVYTDSTRSMRSPEIRYNEKTDQVSSSGPGEFRDGSMYVRSDHLDFDQSTGMARAAGDVVWRDTLQNIGVITDTLDYSSESGYALAFGEARTLFYTVVDGDTLFIAADTLNMWNDIDTSMAGDTIFMMKAYHDVRLYKSDMQGRTDSLVFHGRDSIFSFFGHPVLWSDTTQFSADSINMSLENSRIKDITLNRKAMIISELYASFYDQIKGKTILAYFKESTIDQMWVTGNAESIYYTRDDQSAFIGVNQTICSKMYFTFLDGQIHLLKYYGENSSSITPMHEAQHDTLRLEGFEWRPDERPLNVTDLLK